FFLCLLASLALSNLSAEEPFVKEQVTAANYCSFLNHTATVSDPDHLYEEAVENDPFVTSIVRIGMPGGYSYQVIAGHENFPIAYVSSLSKEYYSDWVKGSLQSINDSLEDNNAILDNNSLKFNRSNFEILIPSTLALSLVAPSTSVSIPTLEKVGGIVGILGLVALCPELMMEGGEVGSERVVEQQPLTTEEENEVLEPTIESLISDIYNTAVIKTAIKTHTDLSHAQGELENLKAPSKEYKDSLTSAEVLKTEAGCSDAKAQTAKAQTAKDEADENKIDDELTAYAAAEKGWLNVAKAYQAALKKAKATDPNNSALEAAFNKIISEAEVNAAVWQVHLTAIEPRKIEHFLANAKGTPSRDNAEKAKSVWAHAVDAYKKIATRTAAHHNDLLLREILQQHLFYAQAREEHWNKAIHKLQKNQGEEPIDETTHLKTLEEEKKIHHKSVRNYVWLKHTDRSFEHWELPGELPNVASTVDLNSIERPELLDEDLEKLGRKLLRPTMSNGPSPAAKKITAITATASLSENDVSLQLAENETPTLTTPPLIDIEKDFEAEIMDESLKPKEENSIRLEARKKANELTAKASTIAKAIKRARAVRAAENEPASETDEKKSFWSDISSSIFGGLTRADNDTKSLKINPKDFEEACDEADGAEMEWLSLACQA
ncbi:MAG: hypothetical protein ACH346_08595, partial [Chthoniobacterales bacterium]